MSILLLVLTRLSLSAPFVVAFQTVPTQRRLVRQRVVTVSLDQSCPPVISFIMTVRSLEMSCPDTGLAPMSSRQRCNVSIPIDLFENPPEN